MISHKAVGSMALVIMAVAGIRVHAQEQTAAELYGRGVHAYFALDYDTAIDLLTESIAKNDADPRAFYFRGLALAARDGVDSGLADFAAGAEREIIRRDKRVYDVNGALQRIQGATRIALEKRRSATRAAALAKKQKQDRIKYETLQRREDVVLFRPNQPAPLVDLELPDAVLPSQDPFTSGLAFSGGQQVEEAAPVVPAADPGEDMTEQARDPFAVKVTPQPKKKPAAENPFGEMTAEVEEDDPVFDENVQPELPPGMNVGGTIMNLLEKTLSGQAGESTERDPFGDGNSGAAEETPPAESTTPPAKSTPPAGNPGNPFD